MATITVIEATDLITDSRADINTNFANLNSDKIETSVIDTDTTLAANSDAKIPSQKAVKTYVDTGGNVNASETSKGIVEEATDAEALAGTATGATGAKLFVTPAKLATVLQSSSTVPTIQLYSPVSKGSTTTRFDITNPSGTTFRYTYDGTGTDPGISTTTFPTGAWIRIRSDAFTTANEGVFAVTGSGTNYFEVTNAAGVAENDKTLTGGDLYVSTNTWTKPTGLKYVRVRLVGGGGGGGGITTDSGEFPGAGGGGGYSEEIIDAATLGATETVHAGPGGGGGRTGGAGQGQTGMTGGSSLFGSYLSATGGVGGTGAGNGNASPGGAGGVGSNGDINANGQGGMSGIHDADIAGSDYRALGGSSLLGGGAAGSTHAGSYGGGGGGAGYSGGHGVVIVEEFYV